MGLRAHGENPVENATVPGHARNRRSQLKGWLLSALYAHYPGTLVMLRILICFCNHRYNRDINRRIHAVHQIGGGCRLRQTHDSSLEG